MEQRWGLFLRVGLDVTLDGSAPPSKYDMVETGEPTGVEMGELWSTQ